MRVKKWVCTSFSTPRSDTLRSAVWSLKKSSPKSRETIFDTIAEVSEEVQYNEGERGRQLEAGGVAIRLG
jgi:hypothetical protein